MVWLAACHSETLVYMWLSLIIARNLSLYAIFLSDVWVFRIITAGENLHQFMAFYAPGLLFLLYYLG